MDNDRIYIFDTTLRDGEQAPGYSMNLDEKVRMALSLRRSALMSWRPASPLRRRGLRQRASHRRRVEGDDGGQPQGAQEGYRCGLGGGEGAVRPRIHTFLATSDLHLQYKLKMSRERALEQATAMVAYARSLCPEVEFSAEDATRTDLDFLCRMVEAVIKAGASVVNLPDTVGYAIPEDMTRMVGAVMNRVPNIDRAIIAVHCHNDLGLAVANSLAGLKAGARQIEGTLCGIGERAGNAAIEEVAMAIRTRGDELPFRYGLVTEEISKSARLLGQITGIKTNPSKAIVGANAFAHESGIHQHGMMANSLTYEIMTPESVGVLNTSFVLGKHSGMHAFEKRLVELGYTLSKEEVQALFTEFKNLADRKKTVGDRDLMALVESTAQSSPVVWELDNFVVNSGNMMTSTACVTLLKGEKKYQEVARGTGPVYASLGPWRDHPPPL